MATEVKETAIRFKKVSGFNPGPLKPNVDINTTGIIETVAADINNYLQVNMPNMAKGETIHIILTVGDTLT